MACSLYCAERRTPDGASTRPSHWRRRSNAPPPASPPSWTGSPAVPGRRPVGRPAAIRSRGPPGTAGRCP
ncbi:hypothetical protein [Plantactinospora sp. KLBMP9567]|uniref:hypothetical protein n=1 Tax=Plantactinospora sp. KLBMP9567 TaxID=3085900 RepID=UPI00298278D4|nr:hypothetical protein [Plantactinospora sp. KLBMP9567]MDW5325239.1 hypothetical protein [Plantactinospora sp. KLBMP9567]